MCNHDSHLDEFAIIPVIFNPAEEIRRDRLRRYEFPLLPHGKHLGQHIDEHV